MTLNAEQRVHNIRTKVRLISDRIWRNEGWGICTGDLERAFILREMDRLAGLTPEPMPDEVGRAIMSYRCISEP
jgi:hypothetical protein